MSQRNIIRAWKDPEYRLSLSEAERAALPQSPAGFLELADAELEYASGAMVAVTKLRGCGGEPTLPARCPRRAMRRLDCN